MTPMRSDDDCGEDSGGDDRAEDKMVAAVQ